MTETRQFNNRLNIISRASKRNCLEIIGVRKKVKDYSHSGVWITTLFSFMHTEQSDSEANASIGVNEHYSFDDEQQSKSANATADVNLSTWLGVLQNYPFVKVFQNSECHCAILGTSGEIVF